MGHTQVEWRLLRGMHQRIFRAVSLKCIKQLQFTSMNIFFFKQMCLLLLREAFPQSAWQAVSVVWKFLWWRLPGMPESNNKHSLFLRPFIWVCFLCESQSAAEGFGTLLRRCLANHERARAPQRGYFPSYQNLSKQQGEWAVVSRLPISPSPTERKRGQNSHLPALWIFSLEKACFFLKEDRT